MTDLSSLTKQLERLSDGPLTPAHRFSMPSEFGDVHWVNVESTPVGTGYDPVVTYEDDRRGPMGEGDWFGWEA